MSVNQKSYVKPELKVFGNVEVLTQGNQSGANLDAPIPTGTPANQIMNVATFS